MKYGMVTPAMGDGYRASTTNKPSETAASNTPASQPSETIADTPDEDDFAAYDREQFKTFAPITVSMLSDYLANLDQQPVSSQRPVGHLRKVLASVPPTHGEPMPAILNDVKEHLLPGLTNWQHPRFMAWFSSSAATPSILADFIAAVLAQNAMLHTAAPSATELEEIVADHLRQMLDLQPTFEGCITDSASISTLMALATARETLKGWNIREHGLSGRPELKPLTVYTSEHGHSSIEKAASILGVGLANVRKIATDADFRMDPVQLRDQIIRDIEAGYQPLAVVATISTTSAGSIDPIPAIGRVCKQFGIYLHIDAAHGGMAAIVPELRHVLAGVNEYADSFATNPHKWLFTSLACGAFYTKRVDLLKKTFSVLPEYLRTSQPTNNFMDWGPHLSRQWRSLKLWFTIRAFGTEGLAKQIRKHIHYAQSFATRIKNTPNWELVAPTPLSLVCFRYHPPGSSEGGLNALNQALLDHVNRSGIARLSHTVLDGRFTLRMAIGNVRTSQRDIELVWEALQDATKQL